MSAALRSSNVVTLVPHDGIVEGKADPLIPAGEYLAMFKDHRVVELRMFRGAPKVFIRFKLVDAGPHTGVVLYRAYRVKHRIDDRRFVVGRRSTLLAMMVRVLDLRNRPEHLDVRSLAHKLFTIRVRTVTHDAHQRPLPDALHYSVVDDVVRAETR